MEKIPFYQKLHFKLVAVLVLLGSLVTFSVGAFALWEVYQTIKVLTLENSSFVPMDILNIKVRELAVFLTVLFLAVTVLAAGVALGIAHQLTKPIQKVVRGATEIAGGNLNYRIPVERQDELGILAQAMNQMVDELAGMYARLTHKINQLSVISDVTKVINSSFHLDDILNSLVEMTKLVFDYSCCALFLLEPSAGTLALKAARFRTDHEIKFRQIPAWVYANGEPLVINNLAKGDPAIKHLLPPEINSVAFIPLKHHGKISGLMVITHQEAEAFSQDDTDILMILGGQAAVAIENALLYQAELENQAQIQQAEKFAVIGELAAGTAHEIRNPLTAIRGFIQLLQDKYRGLQPETEYAALIIKEIDRINLITKEFLKLAKPSGPQFVLHDLNRVIEDVVCLLESNGRIKDIDILTDLDRELPVMELDPDQLKQVFMNLGTNAINAMKDGGTLSVSTRYLAEKGIARVIVRDNGTGIRPEELPKIFDPFFTTRPDGTGLGLAVTYRLVKNHGGEIKVSSRLGLGTEFTIDLPLKKSPDFLS